MSIEKICRQAAILVSSISVLMIVVLASGEIGRGDVNTLTVFAETNAEVLDTVEEHLENTENENKKETKTTVKGDTSRDSAIKRTTENRKGQSQKELPQPKNPAVLEHNQVQQTAAVVPCSQEDYQILLRIVQAEAGICDDTGKVLVANVILNRVRNKEFPDTIKEVVYQKSQFSPVANGTINTCKVTPQTIDCVNRALSGEDYSQGALYFMNRSGARSKAADWFDRRLTFLFQHERHEFFK